MEIANIQSEIRGVQDRIKFLNRIRVKDGATKDKDGATNDKDGAIKDKDGAVKDKDVAIKDRENPTNDGAPASKNAP